MKECVKPLLEWYYKNRRELPWRVDREPYHVWVSEIMLQQTRIEAVKSYYTRFMEKIPTIYDLAMVEEETLLKLWEGLGYYNRARNLKKAAIQIKEVYGGNFPKTYKELIKLPGVGEYTAGAISSICFSEKEVAIDGNVLRVFMRIHNCKDNIDDLKVKKSVGQTIKKILPKDSGSFNEALMELGELICLPNAMPHCKDCPVQEYCKAYQKNTMLHLPIKNVKKEKKVENLTVLLFYNKNEIVINRRKNKGLLENLWEFPNIEGHLTKSELQNHLNEKNISYKKIKIGINTTHTFTHKIWNMISYWIEVEFPIFLTHYPIEEIRMKYALPTAFEPYLNAYEEMYYNE